MPEHDAIHVADRGLDKADDSVIVQLALTEKRVLVTRDTDFEPLVVASGRSKPSVINLRTSDGRPHAEAALLPQILPGLAADLEAGAVVTVDDSAVRILPLA